MASPVRQGILVGRMGVTSNRYLWGVIPKDDFSVDTLEAHALIVPEEELYMVNRRTVSVFLRKLYIVSFVRRSDPVPGQGFIDKAIIQGIDASIPLDEFPERVKEVDDKAVSTEITVDNVDEDFIASLHQYARTGAHGIKRFYSTQIITPLSDDNGVHRILVSLPEAFLFLSYNPGIIKRIWHLPRYGLLFIELGDAIDKETLVEEIVLQRTRSARLFDTMNTRAIAKAAEEEED